MALDGRYKLLFYDVYTKQYGEVASFVVFLEAVDRVDNRNRFKEKQVCYFGRYILSRSKEMLEKKKRVYFSADYQYTNVNTIDNSSKDLQSRIDEVLTNVQKEIDEFYEKYGHAKYNRKDNKAKKDALRKEQKADLEAGITKAEYKEKYNIKGDTTFYDHVKKLYPEWTSREDNNGKASRQYV